MTNTDYLRKRIALESRLSHSLLKSSHDFIESAVQYANSRQEENYKFALLHLASAFELLFKSRLAEEHWSLVFANSDKASVNNLQVGNFLSVDIDTSLKRLKNITNIKLSKENQEIVNSVRNIRNKITHFHVDVNEFSINVLLAKGLNFYIEFYNENIAENWEDYDTFGYKLSQNLIQFKEFVETRLNSIRDELEKSEKPKTRYFAECQYCLQCTFILYAKDVIKCLFCGNELGLKETAEVWSEDEKVNSCPMCNKDTFILTLFSEKIKRYECIFCGYCKEDKVE